MRRLDEDDLHLAQITWRMSPIVSTLYSLPPARLTRPYMFPPTCRKTVATDCQKVYSSSARLLLRYFCQNVTMLLYIYSFSTVFLEDYCPLLQLL